jgi:transcriptional regulator with XRE-family HTH domain
LKAIYDFSILRDLRKRWKWSISDVSRESGVSPAVISKLERNNQNAAGIDTLYKLGRAFDMSSSELIALAELRTAQITDETVHESGGFQFTGIKYDNIKCLYGKASRGASVSRPEIHKNDYEVCWIVKGEIELSLPYEKINVKKGGAVQFDALQEHSYKALEDTEIIIMHIKKSKKF